MIKITKLIIFLIVFINIYIQFQALTRIRIKNLDLWIRTRQKVSDPIHADPDPQHCNRIERVHRAILGLSITYRQN
jgi:hypothetical protein